MITFPVAYLPFKNNDWPKLRKSHEEPKSIIKVIELFKLFTMSLGLATVQL